MREKIKKILPFAGAFLGTYGISFLLNLRGGVKFSLSIFTLVLAAGIYLLLDRKEKSLRKNGGALPRRRMIFAAAVSLLFGVLMDAGSWLQWVGYTEPGYKGKLGLLFVGACAAIPVFPFADWALEWMEKRFAGQPDTEQKKWKNSVLFFAGWFGIWLCWIPVWLAYYPVIMSYDFHRQSLLAYWGPTNFDGHHPLAHSFLLWVARNLGVAMGSFESGLAWFSLFQQMIVSAVLGYAGVMIYRLTRKKWAALTALAFFAFFPLVSVFVMCTTKDVLFGAFFVLFILLFVERTWFSAGRKKTIMNICWAAEGILMVLFRNNAIYAMLPFVILFVLLAEKKERLAALILSVVLLFGGEGALLGIQYGLGVSPGEEIEKYSLVIQCMARAGQHRGTDLAPELKEQLDFYIPEEAQKKYYPPIVDGTRAAVAETKCWDDMGAVLALWLKIGAACPNEYMDAFLDLTRGYWFLDDVSHAEMLGVGLEERMGLLYTYNSAAELSMPDVQHVSKFPWLEQKMELLLSANCYYKYPVISNFFKPALWCWLLVLCAVCCVYFKQKKKLTACLYPLCYFATMLLGPTANIRYTFPILILIPVLLGLLCGGAAGDGGKNGTADEI